MHPLIGEADSHAGAQFLKNNDPPGCYRSWQNGNAGGIIVFQKGLRPSPLSPPFGGIVVFHGKIKYN